MRHPLARRSGVPLAAITLVAIAVAALAVGTAGVPAVAPLARAVPILMYHHVGDWGTPGDWAPWVVRPEDFVAQLDWLVDHGYRSVTLAEVRAHLGQGDASIAMIDQPVELRDEVLGAHHPRGPVAGRSPIADMVVHQDRHRARQRRHRGNAGGAHCQRGHGDRHKRDRRERHP